MNGVHIHGPAAEHTYVAAPAVDKRNHGVRLAIERGTALDTPAAEAHGPPWIALSRVVKDEVAYNGGGQTLVAAVQQIKGDVAVFSEYLLDDGRREVLVVQSAGLAKV